MCGVSSVINCQFVTRKHCGDELTDRLTDGQTDRLVEYWLSEAWGRLGKERFGIISCGLCLYSELEGI